MALKQKLLTLLNRVLIAVVVWAPAAPAFAQECTKALERQGKCIGSQSKIGSLGGVLEKLFDVMLFFLPAIAVIYFVLSGYRYIIAQGNPELVEKAKKSLTYAVFGVVVAFASVVLIAAIAKALGVPTGFKGVG